MQNNKSYEYPLTNRGKPVRGPEVEFDEATERDLRHRLDEMDRYMLNVPLVLQQKQK
jgi:hypothetical protein